MNRGQRNTDGRQQLAGPVGTLVRGLATAIGLATESYQHHKEKKASKIVPGNSEVNEANEDVEDEDEARLSQQMDEAAWELDESKTSWRTMRRAFWRFSRAPPRAHRVVSTRPPPPPYEQDSEDHQLALPVVITQRRPGSRTRGFVRAYSPLLADAGIDQATFLDFLDKLNKSVEPSPWIQAINLASFAGQAVPEPFTVIISMAVKKVTDATSELHSRSKTNQFLDQVNESFFTPRGLVALVMTWKPGQSNEMLTMTEFNMESSIAKASSQGQRDRPLVFPTLDELVDSGDAGEAKKQSAIKRGGNFAGQYMDKRARATWAGENPDSSMANATGQEQFASRYADPNHPASSGDPIALLTGG
ncbi:hypothetical protein PG994_000884 [Apiospora phragmitis]|uniref:Uncharacterized protein n=1 Tax=Apiospora phragmitis TaxID=2905665 RepID=A0ABR1WS50_9PEZI